MAKTFAFPRFLQQGLVDPGQIGRADAREGSPELSRYLLQLIFIRPAILLLALNLADPLGVLPERLGPFRFLPFLNLLCLGLTFAYIVAWRSSCHKALQLHFQIAVDLVLTTVLVAHTRGIESAFVSFYVFIIIYCSLTLGRIGGTVAAALSVIFYAATITAGSIGLLTIDASSPAAEQTFRIAAHALGFIAVALLGTFLHQRLQAVERELNEKIDSLQQLQQLNEHIVSSIRSGLVTTDLQGQVAVFNKAAEELTEKANEEVLHTPVQGIIGEDFWSRIIDADFFGNARALRREQWITLPGGRTRYLGFSVSPLLDGRQLLGYIISFQDLTEIKRLEEEVRLKDRMSAIGRMAAGIAHEIRNPLAAMQGSVQILRSRANLPKSDERLLDILVREGDRLNKFVEDFLHFARPGKYAKGYIDLIPLLRDTVTLLRNSPDVRDRLSVSLESTDQSIPVTGSADQLQQVFWNLARNAVQAMPNGGTLKIESRAAPGGGAEVVFCDNGVGMDPEEKKQLFRPFSSGLRGDGLGLSTIFQIMDDHRGRISCESEKDKGTTITLYFPAISHADTSNQQYGEVSCLRS